MSRGEVGEDRLRGNVEVPGDRTGNPFAVAGERLVPDLERPLREGSRRRDVSAPGPGCAGKQRRVVRSWGHGVAGGEGQGRGGGRSAERHGQTLPSNRKDDTAQDN